MNNKKYKDSYYKKRDLRDLRDMVKSSGELFSSKPAFLVKDSHSEPYRPISYAQFNVDIDALGTGFIKMGLKGKKIAIIGENSYKWVVTYLAATNGTGVVAPIDRELKPKEIANLLNRAEVSALVHSKKMTKVLDEVLPMLNDHVEAIIDMDADDDTDSRLSWDRIVEDGRQAVSEGDRSFLDADIDPDAMCSLLFTSGTTGLAKGVMLSHRNLTANVYNMSKYVDVTDYIGLSVLPMHHSYEMTCHIFTGLYQGIGIAICEGLKYIQKNMAEVHASVMLGVPLIFENIHKKIMKNAQNTGQYGKLRKMIEISKKLKLYNNQKLIRKIFKQVHEMTGNGIQQFIAGGAAIDPRVIEDFEAMGFPMIQGYGMTENAPIIAVNRDRCSKADSVGFVMPGTQVRIVDPDEGGMGEIYCKGPSVMIGYYDNDEETDKVLQDGWLNTGDYGHIDEEGYVYVSGRKKNVIVTKNGKNIFPEEVEFYLSQSDFIEEVLVHGVEDERTGDTVVKAEVFPDFHSIEMTVGKLDDEELRSFLKEEIDKINELMPLYKHVKRFDIRKEEFSKTTTRKIKRYTPVNMDEGEGTEC
ncbi:MAG: AMP-binding protein [Eubacteriaceae bacterium]|nr:AMP-binding protein [Eubacteriaceae bacterium]